IQALFWLVFNPNFVSPKGQPFESYELSNMEFSKLSSPDTAGLAKANYVPVQESPVIFQERGYYSWKFSANLSTIPEEGLGLLPNGAADNIRLYVNKHLIFGEGRMELPDVTYDFLTRPRIRVPAAALAKGENTFEIVQVIELSRETLNFPSKLGDYKTIENISDWRLFLFRDANIVSTTVGFVISFFAFIALLRSNSKTTVAWLFILALLWPIRNLFLIWAEMPLHGAIRPFLYGFTTLSLSAAWPLFVDAWSNKSKRRFVRFNLLIWFLGIALIGYWTLLSGNVGAFTKVETLLNYFGIAFMFATITRLVWHFVGTRDDRYWEAAILIMLVSLLGLFLTYTLLWDQHKGYLDLGQPLLLFAFAIAFFSRNFRLFQSSAEISSLLKTQLDDRTAELELAHAREKVFIRKEAYDHERQRIMRDMHDGLGSNLMSMLLAARRGEAKPEKVAEGLQSIVDEMRLMIDSMDSVGESLAVALATFRERVQSRVEGAGFKLNWTNSAGRDLPELGPRQVLQVFRIMQEAVTNALKHSGGDVIDVNISHSDETKQAVQISISDNGKGMKADKVAGHGLDNMQSRAAAIGAEITNDSDDDGARVTLSLPETLKKIV
ncbi:ATP-binding protein, partial [Parasphingorhabdus sp.]